MTPNPTDLSAAPPTLMIYKYMISTLDYQRVSMPFQAQPLCVQTQDNGLCLWAIVDPSSHPYMEYEIRVLGTGNPFDETMIAGYSYLGSAQTHGGAFVWHVFLRPPWSEGPADSETE